MKCSKIQEQLVDYLEGNLSEIVNSDIKNHIINCENCTKEIEEMRSFLGVLDTTKIEVPSTNLRKNFDEMLAREIEKENKKVIPLQPKTDWKSFLRVAASIVIVISAFLLGKYQSNTETTENKEEAVLALLENTSASKRILAVNNAEQFTTEDTKIIEALINRLFFDENTNVRLAAAEALSKFSSETLVRDAFIKSLETDKNASVQIEVIQILSKIKEKRAIEPMQKLLEKEEIPQFVKQQVQLNLSTLL